jgi:hypothetical protein
MDVWGANQYNSGKRERLRNAPSCARNFLFACTCSDGQERRVPKSHQSSHLATNNDARRPIQLDEDLRASVGFDLRTSMGEVDRNGGGTATLIGLKRRKTDCEFVFLTNAHCLTNIAQGIDDPEAPVFEHLQMHSPSIKEQVKKVRWVTHPDARVAFGSGKDWDWRNDIDLFSFLACRDCRGSWGRVIYLNSYLTWDFTLSINFSLSAAIFRSRSGWVSGRGPVNAETKRLI